MKNVKKILIALLAMILCAATLSSCLGVGNAAGGFGGFESGDATTGDGTDNNGPQDQTSASALEIIKSSKNKFTSEYQIVYGAGSKDYEQEFATKLRDAIKAITGVELPLVSDVKYYDDPSTRKDKEIIIGTTNREELFTIPSDLDVYELGYAIYAANERLVFAFASRTGSYFALRDFIQKNFGQNLDKLDKDIAKLTAAPKALKLPANYGTYKTLASIHLPYSDIPVSRYNVVYPMVADDDNVNYMMKRMAFILRNGFRAATGTEPGIDIETIDTSGAVIRVHLLDKEEDMTGANEWIAPGEWNLTYENKTNQFIVEASSYYGFTGAANYLSTVINSWGFFDFGMETLDENGDIKKEFNANGSYIDYLNRKTESNKYAYDRQGDNRVMFLNVLFGATAGDNGEYSVPPEERNQIQQIMIAEYMPDVLGCQEFNNTKRGGSACLELDGKGGLSGLLADIGYAEAVDPRVQNAFPSNVVIPGTEGIGHLTQPDYFIDPATGGILGYGGGTQVTYNGKTFNTFWNNTPIFYNTKTTKLIAAEYYWYKNQWDRINKDENGNYIHENSNGDAGSKAATWGVFESLATGQRYIVISTHMCTRSDYVRSLQGREIVALIKQLAETYDCPVFFGGDMNGNGVSNANGVYYEDIDQTLTGSGNYAFFLYPGLISMQDTVFEDGSRPCELFTSMVASSHGYPNFDTTDRIMTPGYNDESKIYFSEGTRAGSSIDQIFLWNGNEDLELNAFGFVVDDCSLSSSDHLPYFLDFNIHGETNDGAEFGPTV